MPEYPPSVRGATRMNGIPFSDIRRVLERATQLEKAGRKVLHFEIGRPDFDTPAPIKEAAVDALRAGQVHYSSNYGIPRLRAAIAEKLERDSGLHYRPEDEVIVTVGANEAVGAAFLALLDPGDEVLVPDPAWLHYRWCAQLCGATVVPVPCYAENEFVPDVATVASLITPRTRMLVINTPNNPTGAVYPRAVLEELAKLAQQHDLLVLSDEIYERMVYGGATHTSLGSLPGMWERTMTVNGLSKAYSMTGWRLGFIAAPKPLSDLMVKVHQYTVSGATTFAQFGAVQAYTGDQGVVDDMVASFDRRRKILVEGLRGIKGVTCPEPRGAFYAFPSITGTGKSSAELCELLLEEAGIAVVAGNAFGDAGDGHVRFSYAASDDDLREGIERMAGVLGRA
ncbi:MAG: pyridoxal phosphate-dependent aminotransferase [Chloroflexi bacterium]|nr:pyridoxal phosphate-dependent aminotransferase [Chloroflexota bacterium]